jgi:hypothetical protein
LKICGFIKLDGASLVSPAVMNALMKDAAAAEAAAYQRLFFKI